MALPGDLITKIKALILPYMRDEDARKALFVETYFLRDRRPLDLIIFEGSAEIFTTTCIVTLLEQIGCLGVEEPLHALSALLITVRQWVGVEKHAEIDYWVTILNAECTTPTLELASASPVTTPPQTNKRLPVRILTRREHELTYLDRLRFEDFWLEKFELAKYATLGGVAQQRRSDSGWETLAMQQEFTVIPFTQREALEQETAPEPFTDAVSKITELRRVVVLGEPGAGKTHTLRAIAKPLYTSALNDPSASIPLLVKLGNWDKPDQPFDPFLREALGELGNSLDELLTGDDPRAVMLLDGLNEFPADQRKAKYPQVEAWIKAHPQIMAVVTCREADYPISLHLHRVFIRPLDPLRIRDFTGRALRLKGETEGEAFFWKLMGEDARRFEARFKTLFRDKLPHWETVFWLAKALPEGFEWKREFVNTFYYGWEEWLALRDDPAGIHTLARNPYMLRMLLDVYIQFRGKLPHNRGQLFDQFVNVLLKREQLARITGDTVTISDEGQALLTGLEQLAYEMQIQRARKTDGSAGTALLLPTVRTILNDRLLYLAVSTSILNSGESVRFSHQLLQEYFAARDLRGRIFGAANALRAVDLWKPEHWWERTNWEEAVILLAGLYSDDCSTVVNWVNRANPEVAALCITRSGAELAATTREQLRSEWLKRLTSESEPKPRAAVGRALGMTDFDSRKGVGLREDGLPDLDWVEIPAGKFIYQADQKLYLPTFYMSRYPVTYRQFQAFIDAPDGFYNPTWWDGLTLPDGHHQQPGDQAFKFANHPRERVSWYDAIAFCRWLSFKFGGPFALDDVAAWKVRLPTEFEWEKAARGTEGRLYPYQGEFDANKGNTDETGIGMTSAVGIFPEGVSPYGLHDMSGNVWEWCLSDYDVPQLEVSKELLNSDKSRVLRGGSWNALRDSARAAFRVRYNPPSRHGIIGFRLSCPPSLDH